MSTLKTNKGLLFDENPMDMWTSPSDQPSPFGAYGQTVDNAKKCITHRLPTLDGFSTTYPQAQ